MHPYMDLYAMLVNSKAKDGVNAIITHARPSIAGPSLPKRYSTTLLLRKYSATLSPEAYDKRALTYPRWWKLWLVVSTRRLLHTAVLLRSMCPASTLPYYWKFARFTRNHPQNYMFTHNSQRVQSIKWVFMRVRQETGSTNRVFHDLRHTATTNPRRAGVDTLTTMKITGHKTMAVFSGWDQTSATHGRRLDNALWDDALIGQPYDTAAGAEHMDHRRGRRRLTDDQ
jgi:hypothetical protein